MSSGWFDRVLCIASAVPPLARVGRWWDVLALGQ